MSEIQTRHLCSYQATLEPLQHDVGIGHFGRRMIAVVNGGKFAGERLRGVVLNGGGDWATIDDARDVLRLDVRATWQTDDGAKIHVTYGGVLRPLSVARAEAAKGAAADSSRFYFRITPTFQTGDPRYQWLGDIVVIGMGSIVPGGVSYELFEVL